MSDSKVQMYFAGTVRRDECTPADIVDACFACYDGRDSAMLRFYKGEDVSAADLVTEASAAMADGPHNLKDDAALVALRTWAIRQRAVCDAAQALRDAQDAFSQAAKTANLFAYQSAAIREAACWGGL